MYSQNPLRPSSILRFVLLVAYVIRMFVTWSQADYQYFPITLHSGEL